MSYLRNPITGLAFVLVISTLALPGCSAQKTVDYAAPGNNNLSVQFDFIEHSRLNAQGCHQGINKLMTAQPGSQYELAMAYDDDAPYCEVFQRDGMSGERRVLELTEAAQCQQT